MYTKVNDVHIHIRGSETLEASRPNLDFYENYNVLSIAGFQKPEANLTALAAKLFDRKCYAFGSLYYPMGGGPLRSSENGAAQAEGIWRCGFDGIKVIEGKPGPRKTLGVPLCDPSFNGFYAAAEKYDLPVLMHVADPPLFWDAENCPQRIKDKGWFYDESYTTIRKVQEEAIELPKRFPGIRFIFAHFFYMADDIDFAYAVMENHPNVNIDLTPGMMFYKDLSDKRDEWRKFFVKYQDRILYGSDTHGDDPLPKLTVVDRFLSTADDFQVTANWNFTAHGIDLPGDITEKIFVSNFKRILPGEPRPVDVEYALSTGPFIEECITGKDKPLPDAKQAAVDKEAAFIRGLAAKKQ